jgi:hypothetical protein
VSTTPLRRLQTSIFSTTIFFIFPSTFHSSISNDFAISFTIFSKKFFLITNPRLPHHLRPQQTSHETQFPFDRRQAIVIENEIRQASATNVLIFVCFIAITIKTFPSKLTSRVALNVKGIPTNWCGTMSIGGTVKRENFICFH